MSRDHEQYEENVGAYLLGALTELEVEVFERHLANCVSCRDELQHLRLAADALPQAVEPVVPPRELKESLMRTVWAEAREREAAKPHRRRWSPPFLGRLPQLRPAFAGALAAAALAVGVGIGIGVSNIGGGGAKTLTALVDHSRAPSGAASLRVPGGRGKGALLSVQGLPDPGPGKVYEVWVQRDGTFQPAGALFDVGTGGTGSAGIPSSLKDAQAVAVTAERRGGTLKPTQMPVLTVKLS
jgi:anti-sigma-K factor RskA